MGWGSAIAGAWEKATETAKAAAQQAASTAQTAWDYTKQKASDLYGQASQTAANTVQQAQQAAQSAQNWAGQKVDSAVNAATDAKNRVVDKAVAVGKWTADTTQRTGAAVNQAFDNIADAFTTQPAGAPAQTCPYAGTGTPSQVVPENQCKVPKDTTPPCCVRSLTVKCGHGSRGFILVPPGTKTNTNNDQIIQVIAEKNDVDTITVDFAAGPCARGNGPNMPCLSFDGFDWPGSATRELKGPPSPLMPGQSSSLVGKLVPFAEFFGHFIGPWGDVDYISYPGTVSCCEGGNGLGFEVQVFPNKKWSGEISAGIEGTSGATAKFAIKGELSGTYGVRTVKCTPPSFEIPLDEAAPIIPVPDAAFNGTKAFLDKVLPSIKKFTEGRYVKIKPELPNMKFGGNVEAAEVKGKYKVSYKGEVSLAASPLIGLTGTFDALQWMIDVACYVYLKPPQFSQFVADQIKCLRDEAGKGVGGKYAGAKAEVRLDIIAKGTIGGSMKWEFRPEQDDKASGSFGGDLDISVSGKISGEVRVWKVSYQAGATLVGQSGVGGKVAACIYGEDPAFDGYLEFKGLKIKAMAYQSLGGSSVGTKKEGAAPIADREEEKEKRGWISRLFSKSEANYDSARAEDSANWEMEILKKGYWGKEGTSGSSDGSASGSASGSAGGGGGGGGGKSFDGGGASYTTLRSGSW